MPLPPYNRRHSVPWGFIPTPPDKPYPSYRHYMNSKLWRYIRGEVWRRDKGRCVRCRRSAKHVHHVNYPEGWDWRLDHVGNCVAVCRRCHDELHEISNTNARPTHRPDNGPLPKVIRRQRWQHARGRNRGKA